MGHSERGVKFSEHVSKYNNSTVGAHFIYTHYTLVHYIDIYENIEK